jgi:hypothetical protein
VPLAIFAVAFAVRLAAQVAYGSFGHPQTFEFDDMARSLVSGEGYHYRFLGSDWLTFGFPATPLVLALLHWIGGGPDAYGPVFVGLAAMSAALAPLSYLVARRLSDAMAGLVAATAVTFHPALLLFAVRVHELNVDALLFAAALVLLLDHAAGRRGTGLAVGVVLGVSALARPTIPLFGALALTLSSLRRPSRSLLVTAAVALAIATPWTVRTAVVLGGPTLSPPYNCMTFWLGNDPYATGGPITADGRSVLDAMEEPLRSRVIGRPEAEQGDAFCEDAARFLDGDPLRVAGWWATKLGYFWWFPPHAGMLYPAGLIDLYRPVWAIELGLALVGALTVWRSGSRLALGIVGLQLLVVAGSQSIGYVEGRHRLALEPTIAAVASIGAVSLVRRVRRAFR